MVLVEGDTYKVSRPSAQGNCFNTKRFPEKRPRKAKGPGSRQKRGKGELIYRKIEEGSRIGISNGQMVFVTSADKKNELSFLNPYDSEALKQLDKAINLAKDWGHETLIIIHNREYRKKWLEYLKGRFHEKIRPLNELVGFTVLEIA